MGRMSYLLRVSLPDRPGSLGALATALGAVGADIVSLDVVEHRPDGSAVDDILVELPLGKPADGLVSAAQRVEGVRVEYLRRYAGGTDLHRDLEAVEAMAADPLRAEEVLVDSAAGVFRADWAAVLEVVVPPPAARVTAVHASVGAPAVDGLAVPWLPLERPSRLDPEGWAPPAWQQQALAAAPLRDPSRVLLVGRLGGPDVLPSELARLGHLAALAGSVAAGAARP